MKIVCFGDSVTRGVTFMNGRLRILKKNYPSLLRDLFEMNKETPLENNIEVLNKGVFNDNSDHLLLRLEKDVLQKEPMFVIIGIGGNDCNFQWKEVADQPNQNHHAIVTLDRYINNLKTIIYKTRENGITPILLTLPPLDPVRYYEYITNLFSSKVSHWICKVGGIEHWHGNYNRRLKEVAEESDVDIIDIRTAMKQTGDLKDLISDDGIHPTEQGYKAIAAEIYHKMSSYIGIGRFKAGSYGC